MEESLKEETAKEGGSLLAVIKENFSCKEQDIRNYSPLTLAYIGDAVFELIVRTVIVEQGNRSPQNLHRAATKFVRAGAQSRLYEVLMEEVSEEEQDILKKGRNAHSYTKAKNASVADYRRATGVEALFGYLYLTGQEDRAVKLLQAGLEKCSPEGED